MPTSTASVVTRKPVPYMRQLCKHFGHKVDATFDEVSGSILFEMGACDLDASSPEALVLHARAADSEGLERVEGVVASHLERFGRGDALSVSWVPAATP